MAARSTILVVDDDREIRDALVAHLVASGFDALAAADAGDARGQLDEAHPDLVLLDIMMPGEDGLSLCRHLRESSGIPVILLTALTDDVDKIVGLEVGADDYVTKPFNPRELVARIRAVLRRQHGAPAAAVVSSGNRVGPWRLDEQQAELIRDDGLVVYLTTGELALLSVFLARPGDVLSRDDLTRISRGRSALATERTIDNTISRLRRKIEADPGEPRLIKTVRGGGYRLVAGDSDQ